MKQLIILLFFLFIISCSTGDSSERTQDIIPAFQESVLGKFKPIRPTNEDNVVLPDGFVYHILASYRDPINTKGDLFGYNNDHIEFLAIPNKYNEGMLFVSHESFPSLQSIKKIPQFTKLEKYMVGASIFKIQKKESDWKIDYSYPHNRRYTAESVIFVDGPANRIIGNRVKGTASNCSGGKTLWNSVLSGEEYLDYYSRRKWKEYDSNSIGWIVEFFPFEPNREPIKHTALGRMRHENAVMVLAKTGQVVVYMGDDSNFGSFYKYISKGKYIEGNPENNNKLLSEGTLYGAKLVDSRLDESFGEWVPLDIHHPIYGEKLRRSGFKSQADVLVRCQEAARFLELTKFDRPEDCEIHPDGSIYLALTNNFAKLPANSHGQIVRFIEQENNPLARNFQFETLVKGGTDSGLSSPDNMAIDSEGNLWVATDISTSRLNQGGWKSFGNNGLFFIKTSGKEKGKVYQFASGPLGCELTGPWFSPDEKELFLSVQHPGAGNTGSHWPTGKEAKPSIIVIRQD